MLASVFLYPIVDACTRKSREAFSIARDNNGTEAIKTNGFYYSDKKEEDFATFFIPYQNGVIYGPFAFSESVEELTDELNRDGVSNDKHVKGRRSIVYFWGIYNIRGNKMTIESWTGSTGGAYPTVVNKAFVINDTTLLYKRKEDVVVMRFKELVHKPDSLNDFIPYKK